MTLTTVCEVSFVAAAIPAVLFCWNLLLYREPPSMPPSQVRPKISVLIPARNEEHRSVLPLKACCDLKALIWNSWFWTMLLRIAPRRSLRQLQRAIRA